ncbi:MAG: hypothetical protein NVSMB64_20610 [Candidatus Velthaea sp.]
MMMKTLRSTTAAALVAALAACSSGGTSPTPGAAVPPTVTAPSLKIVGVGDSLTAGVQSNGLLGVPVVPNPVAGSPFQPGVPPTQPNGFFALLYSQANGGVATNNPANSPLPLINAPGIGTILVPNAQLVPTPISAPCGAINATAYDYTTALQSRANPAQTPLDVAVPGQTVHEAIYMIGPENSCVTAPGGPLSGLAGLVNSESLNFWPVLGNFPKGTTQLAAAASLHGQFATVYLGSNDLLKFIFSVGQIAPTDPGQMQQDMVQIITTLQQSGAKVLVSNLIDVLNAGFFIPQPAIPAVLAAVGGPAAGAAAPLVLNSLKTNYGVGAGGYLTLAGLGSVFAALRGGSVNFILAPGDFVPDALAVRVQSLNDAYNAAIAAAVTQTGAALVDSHALVAAGKNGIPVNPPKCCSLVAGGGFFSLDGLHPSNTGYALIANAFIDKLNSAYGTNVPKVNVAAVYAADPFAPH